MTGATDYREIVESQQAEIAALRRENEALRCAMQAIRSLTGMVEIPVTPVVRAEMPAARVASLAMPDVEEDIANGEALLVKLRTEQLMPNCVTFKHRPPMWRPVSPQVDDLVRFGPVAWTRPYDGQTLRLDKSGAHLAAAGGATLAFGQLEATDGRVPFQGFPGFYLVPWFPWNEDGLPHPLGPGADEGQLGGEVWVTNERVKLLQGLISQDRYPEIGDVRGFVSPHKTSLYQWQTYINEKLRKPAIDEGRESERYALVKNAFSSAITMMGGTRAPGQSRVFKTLQVQRPDWSYTIVDTHAVNMWRKLDELRTVAMVADRPELAPVALQAEDEIVIPAAALELFTTKTGSKRAPILLDETGKQLGTFKVKASE